MNLSMRMSRGGLRGRRLAFTLVELMIVVAIIGILAALAIYGANKYMGAAKAAEAKGHVGAISRAAHAAYEREYVDSELTVEGDDSGQEAHQLCEDAQPVPFAGVPQGTKYQPMTSDGDDFDAGTHLTGWKCLRFDLSQPIYYQYWYSKDGAPVIAPLNPTVCGVDCYEAAALADLDGDGTSRSVVARTGKINAVTHSLLASTYVYVQTEEE